MAERVGVDGRVSLDGDGLGTERVGGGAAAGIGLADGGAGRGAAGAKGGANAGSVGGGFSLEMGDSRRAWTFGALTVVGGVAVFGAGTRAVGVPA